MAVKKDLRIYPAFLHEDGKYICVRFPDLPGCNTFGEDYEDALVSAKDALGGHLLCMEEDGDPIPSPTPVKNLHPQEDEVSVLIDVRMDIYAAGGFEGKAGNLMNRDWIGGLTIRLVFIINNIKKIAMKHF